MISGKRILTGDRPTGHLHLGHYVGSLKSRVELQDKNEVFVLIADYHSLTRGLTPEKTKSVKENTYELMRDYLSVGLDPKKVTFYRQSDVPAVAELALLLGMFVSVPRLSRVPTLKEVMRDEQIQQPSFGLLGYPVLQAADILMVGGQLVPVGKDQASHLEVARELARKFNSEFGETFPVPDALITGEVLPGTDGQSKMSKSLDNAVFLSDEEKTVTKKVMSMYTDPARLHASDSGHVEGNPVFTYLDAFAKDKKKVEEFKKRYTRGKVADVEVKEYLAKVLNDFLSPIRKKRASLANEQELATILKAGKDKVIPLAQETLKRARQALHLSF